MLLDEGNCHAFRLPTWGTVRTPSVLSPTPSGQPHHMHATLGGISPLAVMLSGPQKTQDLRQPWGFDGLEAAKWLLLWMHLGDLEELFLSKK